MKNETYFEFDNELNEGFTTVPNYILNDGRLSYKAVGVYVQILQYRNTGKHKVYLKSLAGYRLDKKTAVSTALKELETFGYISREYIRNEKGQMSGMKYIVRMKPIDGTIVKNNVKNNDKHIENTTVEPKTENLLSDNLESDNTPLKIKCFKKENVLKENVVVVEEKEKQLMDLYKSFKLEKKVMPHTKKLLCAYKDKFDLEVFEQIFIDASEDKVKSKYRYIQKVLMELSNKNIFTLKAYLKDKAANKNKGSKPGKKLKTRHHNITNNTEKYTPAELEELLKESQKDKFNKDRAAEEINEVVEEINEVVEVEGNAFTFKPKFKC